MIEIYNEELFDLLNLSMDNQKMRLFEHSTRKVRNIILLSGDSFLRSRVDPS